MSSRNTLPLTPAAPVWRQFSFFDLSNVTDPQDLGQAPEAFRSLVPPYLLIAPSPSSPLAGSISTIISNVEGDVILLDHRFQTIKKFKAWNSGADDAAEADKGKGRAGSAAAIRGKEKGVMLVECGGVLLGIGEDDFPTQHPILKIWDLMHEDKKTRQPLLMRNIRIGSGGRGFSVSSMSTTSNLSYLAIGLISGQVLLYRHLSQSLLTSPLALTSFPKPRVVMEGSMAEPITGLAFREPHSAGSEVANGDAGQREESAMMAGATERTSLFVTTPNKTFVIPVIAGKSSDPVLLEELGAGIGCTSISSTKRELIVGRDDGIYMYGVEGRGSVFAYEGEKSEVKPFKGSIVIVSPPFSPTAGSQSATIRRAAASAAAASAAAGGLSNAAKVTVFDLVNRFVAYSGVFKEGVREVFSDGDGMIYVVGGDGKLSRLVEQSTAVKLDVLHRKSLYQMSVQLAKTAGLPETEIADIHAKYGDYLYSKGDFGGAMSQFVKTLGFVQPSYVIRKFLDGQRIHNLTTYLQELHSTGLANADHTTLLLNCYTKTADKARLDHFIKTETSKSDKDAELPFDLETAIRVCRQAGFYEHAVYLAKKYGRHEDYLRIQLEDAGDFADALTYIRQLDPRTAERNLRSYGRQLLSHQPGPTTDLMIDLCSGSLLRKRKRAKEAAEAAKVGATTEKSSSAGAPAYLSYLGYDQVVGLMGVGGSDKEGTPTQPGINARTVSSSGLEAADGVGNGPPILVDDTDTIYSPPYTRPFFPHFIEHPQEFIRFLESVAANRWGHTLDPSPRRQNSHLRSPPLEIQPSRADEDSGQKDQRAIWNTLFELYLADSVRKGSPSAGRSHEKAMEILLQADSLPLDPMHALILCSTNNFTAGLVRLWEKLGMYEDVLRFWMAQTGQTEVTGRSPSENVLYCLNAYGPDHPRLYPLVLRYLSSTNALLARHSKDVRDILQIIDEERIMPALSVVQLLSRNGVTSIGVVKDWLRGKVAETRQDVESDKQLVASYRSETAEKLKEINELSDPARPQVFQVTRCASCGGQLDLPSVHFMCKHSYHQRCLPDSDPECPACARQFAVIREVRRNQQALAERHDLFLSEVEEAQDGFAVVAGAYGRGLLSKQVRDVPA